MNGSDARPLIRLKFVDFWADFNPRDNFFTRLLESRYRLDHCDSPDFVIYSCMGGRRKEHLQHNCVRIFYSGENVAPDWNTCDWAFTFEYTPHPRHFRLPLWGLYGDPAALVLPQPADFDAVLSQQTRFCAFVVSNPLWRTRNDFFRKLSRYKPVDSGGKVLNTIGHRVTDKRAFLSAAKFTIAFENESHAGYTTEKILDPMLVHSIPIYWGDPLVGRDFDTRSFLSAHDSSSLDELVERVVAVDRDPALHRLLLERPWYRNNVVPACVDPTAIAAQFTNIFESSLVPVAHRHGLKRLLRIDRIPATLASLRRRIVCKARKIGKNA